MAQDTINITILDKEYVVACEQNEKEQLMAAAEYVKNKIEEIKTSGLVGSERLAVMTALNIAGELLNYRNDKETYTQNVSDVVGRLQGKINQALSTTLTTNESN